MVTRKLLIYINSLLLTVFTVSLLLVGVNAFATSTPLTWQDEVDVQFTFNPALSVTISDGDIIIPNLGVGTRDNSNEIAITVTTNNIAGYQLSATVGNATTYDYRELKHETTSTALFNSLAVGTTLNQLSTPSTWGYSTDSGTSYSGLPKYDDTTNVAVLNDSTASGTETTNFLIGAYADQNQLAGDYKNVINFNVVTNVAKTYMQNLDPSLCTTTPSVVYDNRDEEAYTIARLADGKCWMLDNLRFDIVTHKDDISSANTNITNSATLTSLKTGNRSAGDQYATAGVDYWTSDNSISVPLIAIKNASDDAWNPDTVASEKYGNGSGKIGVYYNYCAATAGSYCYSHDDSNGDSAGTSSGNAEEDICPAGWRMPSGGNSGEYRALYTAYSSDVTDFKTALSTPLSGYFNNGSAGNQGSSGGFWSSERRNSSSMYYLRVDSSRVSQAFNLRGYGYSVRCSFQ